MSQRKSIIVFSPHPDDETLGVGGTILKKIEQGYEVIVVILTDGRHAFSRLFRINSHPTPEETIIIRKKEVESALNILGVQEKNIYFLDFEDGTLENNETIAEEKIIQILTGNIPMEAYLPYFKDENPDHRATNRIVQNAILKSGLAIETYQYSIVQYSANFGPLKDSFINFFIHNQFHSDISKFVTLKKVAIDKFNSQISIISTNQERPVLTPQTIDKHLRNYEVFYVKNHLKNRAKFYEGIVDNS